jgi:hypothetical protein
MLAARPPPPAFLFPFHNVKDQGRRTGPLVESNLSGRAAYLEPTSGSPSASDRKLRSALVERKASILETVTVPQEAFVSKPTCSARAPRVFTATVTQSFQALARRQLRGPKARPPRRGALSSCGPIPGQAAFRGICKTRQAAAGPVWRPNLARGAFRDWAQPCNGCCGRKAVVSGGRSFRNANGREARHAYSW